MSIAYKRDIEGCVLPWCDHDNTTVIDSDWNLYFCDSHIAMIDSVGYVHVSIGEMLKARIDPDKAFYNLDLELVKCGMYTFFDRFQFSIETQTWSLRVF